MKLTEANTPGVGRVLDGTGLAGIPEAHCWLRYRSVDIDLTIPPDRPDVAAGTFLHEETITPKQIGAYKAQVHERFLVRWLAWQKRIDLDVANAWRIREGCITALSARTTTSATAGDGSDQSALRHSGRPYYALAACIAPLSNSRTGRVSPPTVRRVRGATMAQPIFQGRVHAGRHDSKDKGDQSAPAPLA